jgi:hypothetical protein
MYSFISLTFLLTEDCGMVSKILMKINVKSKIKFCIWNYEFWRCDKPGPSWRSMILFKQNKVGRGY